MIILTDHAKQRMAERIGVKPHKYQRLAEKAWESDEPVNRKTLLKEYQTKFYTHGGGTVRQLMGYTFIFHRTSNKNKSQVLMTVI